MINEKKSRKVCNTTTPGSRSDRRRHHRSRSSNNNRCIQSDDVDARPVSENGGIYDENWDWDVRSHQQVQEIPDEMVTNDTNANRMSSRRRLYYHERLDMDIRNNKEGISRNGKEEEEEDAEIKNHATTEATGESIGTTLVDDDSYIGFITPTKRSKRSSTIHDMGISPRESITGDDDDLATDEENDACSIISTHAIDSIDPIDPPPAEDLCFCDKDDYPLNIVGDIEEEPKREEPVVVAQTTQQAAHKSFFARMYTRIIGPAIYLIAIAITLGLVMPILRNGDTQDDTGNSFSSISTNNPTLPSTSTTTAATTTTTNNNNNNDYDDGENDAFTKTPPCLELLQEDHNHSTMEMISPPFQSRGIYQQHFQWRGPNSFDTRQQLLLQLLYESYTYQIIQPSITKEKVTTTCIVQESDFQAIPEAIPTAASTNPLLYRLSVTYQVTYESNVVRVYDLPVRLPEFLNDHRMILQTDMTELGFPVEEVSFVLVVRTETIPSNSPSIEEESSSSVPLCNESFAENSIPVSTLLSSGTTNYNSIHCSFRFCFARLINIVVVLVGFVLLQ